MMVCLKSMDQLGRIKMKSNDNSKSKGELPRRDNGGRSTCRTARYFQKDICKSFGFSKKAYSSTYSSEWPWLDFFIQFNSLECTSGLD